jgi:uncharacterized protein (TIGR02118 family)
VAKIIALYKHPENPTEFDSYYFSNHVPIAKKVPGLRRYEVSAGGVSTLQGRSDFHMVAELTFDSVAAIREALASPEGAATAADLGNFANAGVELLIYDSKVI